MQILATARRSAPKRSNMELGCARALGHTQRRTASECALVLAHFERVRLRATFTVAVAESRGRCGRPQCLSRGARNAMCTHTEISMHSPRLLRGRRARARAQRVCPSGGGSISQTLWCPMAVVAALAILAPPTQARPKSGTSILCFKFRL